MAVSIIPRDYGFKKPDLSEEKERKKIFNKKAHYRNLKLQNRFEPAKDFEELDSREMLDYHKKIIFDKTYLKVMNDWQLNLESKRRHKAVTKKNFEEYVSNSDY